MVMGMKLVPCQTMVRVIWPSDTVRLAGSVMNWLVME